MKYNLFFSLLCLLFSHIAIAQCSISGSMVIDATNASQTANYTINAPDCSNISSVTFDPAFDNLGTISNISCNGFRVNFNQTSGSGRLIVQVNNANGPKSTCTFSITSTCNPNLIVNQSDVTCGGEDDVSLVVANSNNAPISNFTFNNLNGVVVNSANIQSGTLVANLSLTSDCDAGSYSFTVVSHCGGSRTFSRTIARNAVSLGSMEGDEALCLSGSGIWSVYNMPNVQNLDSDCVDINWTVSPTTGATVFQGGGTGALLNFNAEGSYTVRATITSCGTVLPPVSKMVTVCREFDYSNTEPYTGIAICSGGNPNCFVLPDWCFTEMDITTNDHKLWIDYDGERTICVQDILHFNRERTSSIFITPTNECGAGPTIEVLVDVNDPYLCDSNFERNAAIPTEDFILAEVNNTTIRFDLVQNEGTAAEQESYLELFDINGRLLAKKNFTGKDLNINDRNLPSGILVAHLMHNGKTYVKKFLN